jgi:hypothetical protein
MKFLILEQKYMECLEDGRIIEALKCLRDELAPLKYNTDKLHELSRLDIVFIYMYNGIKGFLKLFWFFFLSFLMCTNSEELKKLSKWNGKTSISRQSLMDKLQCKNEIFN